jgi:hypothetical protein
MAKTVKTAVNQKASPGKSARGWYAAQEKRERVEALSIAGQKYYRELKESFRRQGVRRYSLYALELAEKKFPPRDLWDLSSLDASIAPPDPLEGIAVPEPGEFTKELEKEETGPDLIRDILWVYDNFDKRNAKKGDAPGGGAWSLLGWSRQYKNRFFEQLLPKALAAREAAGEGDTARQERIAIERMEAIFESYK